jgi:hypothetical protein
MAQFEQCHRAKRQVQPCLAGHTLTHIRQERLNAFMARARDEVKPKLREAIAKDGNYIVVKYGLVVP